MDAFDVLGLVPAFDLDTDELERRYRELQKQLHPDKFVHASSSERRASLSRAVSVNDAYRALKDELKRAELLFTRYAGPAGKATVDPALLTEIMELREQLASAKKRRDMTSAQALGIEVDAKQGAERATLRAAFEQLARGHSPEAARAAEHALTRLRYFRRLLEEVASMEDELSG